MQKTSDKVKSDIFIGQKGGIGETSRSFIPTCFQLRTLETKFTQFLLPALLRDIKKHTTETNKQKNPTNAHCRKQRTPQVLNCNTGDKAAQRVSAHTGSVQSKQPQDLHLYFPFEEIQNSLPGRRLKEVGRNRSVSLGLFVTN